VLLPYRLCSGVCVGGGARETAMCLVRGFLLAEASQPANYYR
jgi:hypothetical protein